MTLRIAVWSELHVGVSCEESGKPQELEYTLAPCLEHLHRIYWSMQCIHSALRTPASRVHLAGGDLPGALGIFNHSIELGLRNAQRIHQTVYTHQLKHATKFDIKNEPSSPKALHAKSCKVVQVVELMSGKQHAASARIGFLHPNHTALAHTHRYVGG